MRQIDDESLTRYVAAEFEGRGGGWLGTFARDGIESYLHELEDALCEAREAEEQED